VTCEKKVMDVWKQARDAITGRAQQQNEDTPEPEPAATEQPNILNQVYLEQPEQDSPDSVPRTPPPPYSPWPTDATNPPQEVVETPPPVHVRYKPRIRTHRNSDVDLGDICTFLFKVLTALIFIIGVISLLFSGVLVVCIVVVSAIGAMFVQGLRQDVRVR